MNRFLLILLALASANAFAEINKWVDEHGQVHYSDQPPPSDIQVKTLRTSGENPDSAGSGTAEAKTFVEREAELKKEKAEQQSAADKAAEKKAAQDTLKANCLSAQENLRSLQSGARIMQIDANGQRSYLNDTQLQQRIENAQQNVSRYCK